jgi:hypothetical protein
MHTVSVLTIRVAWTSRSLSHFVRMEQLTTWLRIAAGVLVLSTGITRVLAAGGVTVFGAGLITVATVHLVAAGHGWRQRRRRGRQPCLGDD